MSIHKMIFNGNTEKVRIEPLSENSPFHYKIIPAEIKYETLTELLNGNFDNLNDEDIIFY